MTEDTASRPTYPEMTVPYAGTEFEGSNFSDRDRLIPTPESFQLVNDRIVAKYGEQLPPPDSNVSVISVVIARKELNNGHLIGLIRSANAQSEEGRGKFEVLYVVNNSIEDADVNSDAYQENQKTLKILSALANFQSRIAQGEADRVLKDEMHATYRLMGLSPMDASVIVRAAVNGTRIIGVDASSRDRAFDIQKYQLDQEDGNYSYNRSWAKNIGSHLAYARLQSTGHTATGIIDYSDADVRFSRKYFQDLASAGIGDKGEFFLKRLYPITDDIPEGISLEKNDYGKLVKYIYWLKKAFYTNFDYIQADRSTQSHALRASTFQKLKRYCFSSSNEDYSFYYHGMSILGKDNFVRLTNAYIILSNRINEGSADGAIFEYTAQKYPSKIWTGELMDYIRYNDLDMMWYTKGKYFLMEDLHEMNSINESSKVYLQKRSEAFRREKLRRQQFLTTYLPIIEQVANESPETMIHKVPAYEGEFVIIARIVKRIVTKRTVLKKLGLETEFEDSWPIARKMEKFLQLVLPEYFIAPPDQEPEYRKGAILTGNLRDYIHLIEATYLWKEVEKY